MNFLQQYVQQQLGWDVNNIKSSYQELQQEYRTKTRIGYKNLQQIQAYVFARFPATYKVCLKLTEQYIKNLKINSILDWGCGIGTASLALSQYFHNLECFLIEQDKQAENYAVQFIKHFHPNNSIHQNILPKNVDLSIFSYSLGETTNWQNTLDEIWDKTNYLMIIEPGTTMHFQRLLQIRNYMLTKVNAHLLGPCCHAKQCPLQDDWCHFSTNVPRSKEHRLLKRGQRGFEHEAYSYMFFSKTFKKESDFARLIAPPRIHGGHVDLRICTKDGDIFTTTISKSHHEYKTLKKSIWGDTLKSELP